MSIEDKIKKHVGMGVTIQRYSCAGCHEHVEVGKMDAVAGSKAIGALGWKVIYFVKRMLWGLVCPKCAEHETAAPQ